MGLQVWLRAEHLSRLLFQMGSRVGTHVVAGRIGLHRILSGQRYAAHGNDHEDAHLEVAQVQDVMAQPAKAVGRAGSHSDCRLMGPSLRSPTVQFHCPTQTICQGLSTGHWVGPIVQCSWKPSAT